MKKLLVIALSSTVLLTSGCNFFWGSDSDTETPSDSGKTTETTKDTTKEPSAKPGEQIKKYDVKEGHIKYKLTGFREGTKDVYFVDYGRKELVETHVETKMGGMELPPEDSIVLNADWKVRSYDLNTKEGTIMDLPEELAGITEEQAEQMKQALGEDTDETKTIAGKTCTIFRSFGGDICFWEKIPLSSVVGQEGSPSFFTEEAVEINIGPVPAAKMKFPVADSELKKMGNPLDMMKKL